MAKIIDLLPENCEDALVIPGVTVLYFRAEWCGFCKTMSRIIEQVAAEAADEVTFVKCDVEKCPEFAARFEVTSIPRMVIFKDGLEVKRINSSIGKAPLLHELEQLLKG
ncbi:MAG: thiol reductase thioredoxin [Lentisphaeria bacterium]|nr:thiol reductase thioredoxin [Lentisphaeria bacterium]